MNTYILYKIHDNEDCYILQNIVRYMYFINIDIRPFIIIERNIPKHINILPTIFIDNQYVCGINTIIKYFEDKYNVFNLLENSNKFYKCNPEYRINDRSTHKNIVKI